MSPPEASDKPPDKPPDEPLNDDDMGPSAPKKAKLEKPPEKSQKQIFANFDRFNSLFPSTEKPLSLLQVCTQHHRGQVQKKQFQDAFKNLRCFRFAIRLKGKKSWLSECAHFCRTNYDDVCAGLDFLVKFKKLAPVSPECQFDMVKFLAGCFLYQNKSWKLEVDREIVMGEIMKARQKIMSLNGLNNVTPPNPALTAYTRPMLEATKKERQIRMRRVLGSEEKKMMSVDDILGRSSTENGAEPATASGMVSVTEPAKKQPPEPASMPTTVSETVKAAMPATESPMEPSMVSATVSSTVLATVTATESATTSVIVPTTEPSTMTVIVPTTESLMKPAPTEPTTKPNFPTFRLYVPKIAKSIRPTNPTKTPLVDRPANPAIEPPMEPAITKAWESAMMSTTTSQATQAMEPGTNPTTKPPTEPIADPADDHLELDAELKLVSPPKDPANDHAEQLNAKRPLLLPTDFPTHRLYVPKIAKRNRPTDPTKEPLTKRPRNPATEPSVGPATVSATVSTTVRGTKSPMTQSNEPATKSPTEPIAEPVADHEEQDAELNLFSPPNEPANDHAEQRNARKHLLLSTNFPTYRLYVPKVAKRNRPRDPSKEPLTKRPRNIATEPSMEPAAMPATVSTTTLLTTKTTEPATNPATKSPTELIAEPVADDVEQDVELNLYSSPKGLVNNPTDFPTYRLYVPKVAKKPRFL